jgi:hypothetical protein
VLELYKSLFAGGDTHTVEAGEILGGATGAGGILGGATGAGGILGGAGGLYRVTALLFAETKSHALSVLVTYTVTIIGSVNGVVTLLREL